MSHGGARRGAGRKPGSKTKKPQLLSNDIVIDPDATVASNTIVDLMQRIANDPNAEVQMRLDAAKAVAPYLVARIGVRSPTADGTNSHQPAKVFVIAPIQAGCQLGPSGEVVTFEEAKSLWEAHRATGRVVPLFTGSSSLATDDDPVTLVDDDDAPDDGAA